MNTANCRKCEMPLDIGAEFCGNCGTAVDPIHHPAPADPATTVAVQPDGEVRFNGHATLALVLGVMALPASLFFPIGIPVSVSAFTLGVIGRHSQRRGRAAAAIILGLIAIVLTVVIFLL